MTTDLLLVRSFAQAIHQSPLTAEQTMILAQLAITADEEFRGCDHLGKALGMAASAVGRRLSELNRLDLVEKPSYIRPYRVTQAGRDFLRDIATRIKNGCKPSTKHQ